MLNQFSRTELLFGSEAMQNYMMLTSLSSASAVSAAIPLKHWHAAESALSILSTMTM